MLEGVLPGSFSQGSPFRKLLTRCLCRNGLAEKTTTSCVGFSNEEHQQYILISAWASPEPPTVIPLQQIIAGFVLDGLDQLGSSWPQPDPTGKISSV